MSMGEEIRAMNRRTELLAPAGRADVLESVLAAGADAVYLSGKRFQMRAHRSDFHFDDEALRETTHEVHRRGKRIYVTVNTILGAHELGEARRFIEQLQAFDVDGVILCDLATIAMAKDAGTTLELHASTMMNVHDVDQALVLKGLGISRIITSRDISIRDAGILGQEAGMAVEYFLHGDMCVAQSGQCAMSGLIFGKSSNRGECMKPCRWTYELVNLSAGNASRPLREGHLMALRDLSLIRQIPELVEAGVCALKIEGRMRDAAYLGRLVGLYREAIDQYYAMPGAYSPSSELLEGLFRDRVRGLSSLTCAGTLSNASFFDISGKREPLTLSDGAVESSIDFEDAEEPDFVLPERGPVRKPCPELAVCVASCAAAKLALDAGADRIYLAAETGQLGDGQWTSDTFREAMCLTNDGGVALGIRTPRVTDRHARAEWKGLIDLCRDHSIQYVLVHHLGALKRARESMPEATAIADYGFNILNWKAAQSVKALGAGIVAPALETSFEDAQDMVEEAGTPIELLVHGPMAGMLIDHCLIALNLTKAGTKDACRGPCKHAEFALRDRKGEVRAIIADQYCRNHVLTAKDLGVLPRIDAFLRLGAASFRIEAQFYTPGLVGKVVAAYRRAFDRWEAGEEDACPSREEWRPLMEASPRPWNYGAYAKDVTRSESTAHVMRAQK